MSSKNPLDRLHNRRDLLKWGLALGAGAMVLSGCTSPDATAPTPSVSQPEKTPSTPGASEAPTSKLDVFHATKEQLAQLSQQELFPLPKEFTPGEIVGDGKEAGIVKRIAEIYPITAEEGNSPENFIQAYYIRTNASNAMGSDEYTVQKSVDGDGTVMNDRAADVLAGYQAINGFDKTARPPKDVTDASKTAMYAQLWTNMATKYGWQPDSSNPASLIKTAYVQIPNMSSLKVTKNPDGTFDVEVEERNIFKVNQPAIDSVVTGMEFKAKDVTVTRVFKNCGPGKDGNMDYNVR